MAITIHSTTLTQQDINGEIQYIYPKTDAESVEYDHDHNVKEKIDSLSKNVEELTITNFDYGSLDDEE